MTKISRELSYKFSNMAFLCACLVVLIHIEIDPSFGTALWWVREMFAHQGVTKVAVPFFFLASGFFLSQYVAELSGGGYFCIVRKRFRSLMVPFMIWNALYILFMMVLKFLSGKFGFVAHIPFPACETVIDCINAIGLNPISLPGHPHLWFIRCLFLFVVLAPIFWCGVKRLKRGWAWGCLFVVVGLIVYGIDQFCSSSVRAGLDYNFSIAGVFYFCFGLYLRSGEPENLFLRWVSSFRVALALSIVGVICFLAVAVNDRFGLECSALRFCCQWFGIAFLMTGVFGLVPERNVCGKWAGYSFPIYVLHKFVLILLAGVSGLLGWRDRLTHESVLGYFGRMVIVVVLVCWLMQIGRRCVPRLLSVLFGRRVGC